jgi:uncharacterized protein YukE
MATARLPELHSIGPTVAILAGLAFVLSQAGGAVAGARGAVRAAEEVRAKGKRLVEDLEQLQAIKGEVANAIRSSTPSSAAQMTSETEAMTEAIERFGSAIRRSEEAARMLAQAADHASRFGPILERMHPGWHQAVGKLRPMLNELRKEIGATHFDRVALSVQGQIGEMLMRSLEHQGFADWASDLPDEDDALFDEADVQPIQWDPTGGEWLEGHR